MRNRLIVIVGIVFVLPILTVGCLVNVSTTHQASQTHNSQPQIIVPSPTLSEKRQTVTPTGSLTPSPWHPTTTPSSTLTPQPPTYTSLPTLSTENAYRMVFGLLENNGGCLLPCLFSLIPGQTDIQYANNFMAQFGTLVSPDVYIEGQESRRGGRLTFGHRENNVQIWVDFVYKKNREGNGIENLLLIGHAMYEHEIELDWIGSDISPLYGDPSFSQAFQYYMLPQILSSYGLPSQVLIYTVPNDPWEYITFVLILFYPEQGIFLEYEMPRESVGNDLVGCPLDAQVRVVVASPEQDLPLEYFVDQGGGMVNSSWLVGFRSIDEVSSMTMDEFYTTFSDPNTTACIKTPADLW